MPAERSLKSFGPPGRMRRSAWRSLLRASGEGREETGERGWGRGNETGKWERRALVAPSGCGGGCYALRIDEGKEDSDGLLHGDTHDCRENVHGL